MTKDPWTDPDPQPGDFDAELASTDPHDLQVVDAGSGAKVRLLVSVEGEDAANLGEWLASRSPLDDEPWTEADEAAVAEVHADRAAGVPTISFDEIKRKYGLA